MKSTPPPPCDTPSSKRAAGVMFGKWSKKKSHNDKSSSAKTDKDHHSSSCQVLEEKKRKIRKRPASSSKTKMMIMGLTPNNDDHANKIPSLPSEDMMSFDTLHSTPRARTKLNRDQINVYDRGTEQQKKSKDSSSKLMESFLIPCSIDFISLLLPGGEDAKSIEHNTIADRDDGNSSCAMSTSDAGGDLEEATITSGAFSFISGRTVLAKDRVQETISSTINIDRYFNSSPRAIAEFPSFHQLDVPINVDFVLESSEDELAVFAKRCLNSGNFRDAIDIYESVLDIHLKQQKKNHRFVIPILHNLTVVHTWNGNYNKALNYCKECLTWRREKLGYDHIDVAASLSELGIIHYAKEDFNKALGALREALQIYSKAHKPHRPNHFIARTLNNIGCIHFSTGKLSASLSTFEECLELQRRTMGSITGARVERMLFNMSVTLINAATVAEKQGNSIHASSLMEEGLIVLQSILPDDHRIVTSVRKTLSRIECSQQEQQLAVDSFDSVGIHSSLAGKELTLRQRLHNICNVKESPKTVTMDVPEDLNFSCAEMLTLGSPQSDLNIQDRIKLHMNKNRLPHALIAEGNSKRHCSWVDINNNNESGRDKDFNFLNISQKAGKYIKRNDVPKAIRMFANLKQNHKTKCGDVTYILGTISFMLGIIYLYTAQYDQALSHFCDSMKIRSSVLDSDHSDVLASLSMIAITMIAMKNFDVAQAHLEKVLRLTRKKYGYNDEKVAAVLNNIGLCHYEMGGLLTASKTFEECVEILREASNNGKLESNVKVQISIMQARSLNNLAFIRFKRREFADAIVALEEALKLQRRIFGDDSQVVKDTLRTLGTCMATANCDNNKDKLEHMAEMYADMLAS